MNSSKYYTKFMPRYIADSREAVLQKKGVSDKAERFGDGRCQFRQFIEIHINMWREVQ